MDDGRWTMHDNDHYHMTRQQKILVAVKIFFKICILKICQFASLITVIICHLSSYDHGDHGAHIVLCNITTVVLVLSTQELLQHPL
jgi:hypothetical protein